MDALVNTGDLVARSTGLLQRQEALIESLERVGEDTRAALALYYEIYRNRLFMIEYDGHRT